MTDWPVGVPSQVLRSSAAAKPGTTVIRSPTDSGRARQRAVFTAVDPIVVGVIRMTQAQYLTFETFRQGLAGGAFVWPGHPWLTNPTCRFAGDFADITMDQTTAKFLVPVSIEVLA